MSDPVTIYDFYECEDCCTGYAVEEGNVDEPVCPVCQCDNARFVASRSIAFGVYIANVGNCVQCERKATLQLDDEKFICESCAQDMNDMAP